MQNKQTAEFVDTSEFHIYGEDEMLNSIEPISLHSTINKKIQDYGELCDTDCKDCD